MSQTLASTPYLLPLVIAVGMTAFYVLVGRKKASAVGRSMPEPVLDPGPPLPLHAEGVGEPGFQWRVHRHEVLGGLRVPVHWAEGEDAGEVAFHDERTGAIIRLQHQPNVQAQGREQYTESFIEVNRRDAPRYELSGIEYGSLGRLPAARVEGRFDNGTQYYTRSYVIFSRGAAVMLMARAPSFERDSVTTVIDAMVGAFARGQA